MMSQDDIILWADWHSSSIPGSSKIRLASAFMKLVTFTEGGRTGIGVVEDGEIVDLSREPTFTTDMITLLGAGEEGLKVARTTASKSKQRFALSSVRLEAPVLNPRKFLGLGGSYKSHL